MSEVTFSDWEGLARYGLTDLELRSSTHGTEMKVRTAVGDLWVPMTAEDFTDAASIATKYVEAQAAGAREWGARETEAAIRRLERRGYTVIPPDAS